MVRNSKQNWQVGATVNLHKGEKTLEQLLAHCSPVPFSGCLVWIDRSISNVGYGQIWSGGRRWPAHKLSYELVNGPVPDGLELDHLCRVRCCINPDHLEPVTRQINVIRGLSPALSRERQIGKTHCRNGHEFTPENTYFRPNRERLCIACHREQSRRSMQKARGRQDADASAVINALAVA